MLEAWHIGSVETNDLERARAGGLELAPWHLGVEIAPGLTTEDLYRESDQSEPFYDPGPAIKGWFTSLYPDGLEGRSAFDFACNNGAFLFALKEIGAGRCFGSDVRKHWIDQARFLVEHRHEPSDDMEFEVADLYEIPDRGLEPFDIGIFSGVFYHLPDPIHGLRIAADLTKEVLFVSTASRGDHPDDLLVAVEESTTQARSGVHGLAFFPTGPKVLARLLGWMGFPAVRCLNWWNPSGTASYLDSIQLVAAREERFLDGLDRQRPAGHAGMLLHIQETIRPRAPILVVRTDGDEPLDVPYREVWEFPEARDPTNPTKLPPPDARSLITQLDGLWAAGAEYLVVPSSAFPWLEENPEFKSFLDFRYTAPVRDPTSCILYNLGT
jgi:tRNA (mo5U34)-methyltransferase